MSSVGAWRDREVEVITGCLAPHALALFHAGLERGRKARELFGAQSLAPLLDDMCEADIEPGITYLRAVCGDCGRRERECRCHVRQSNVRSFLGREED